MKKTKILVLHSNSSAVDDSGACGFCFELVESEDSFCKACGIQFDEEPAYAYTNLKEFMDLEEKSSS